MSLLFYPAAQPVCAIGLELPVNPRDGVITSQCVKQEEQNDASQLEAQPMETLVQTSGLGTELNQQPSSVFVQTSGPGTEVNQQPSSVFVDVRGSSQSGRRQKGSSVISSHRPGKPPQGKTTLVYRSISTVTESRRRHFEHSFQCFFIPIIMIIVKNNTFFLKEPLMTPKVVHKYN